jgi:hypothetical protein
MLNKYIINDLDLSDKQRLNVLEYFLTFEYRFKLF